MSVTRRKVPCGVALGSRTTWPVIGGTGRPCPTVADRPGRLQRPLGRLRKPLVDCRDAHGGRLGAFPGLLGQAGDTAYSALAMLKKRAITDPTPNPARTPTALMPRIETSSPA